jgi:hypothetical protein
MAVYKLVKAGSLKPWPFNPPHRIERKNIEKLAKKIILARGIWSHNPIIVGSDGYVADGHRRLYVIMNYPEFGADTKVPVCFADESTSTIFMQQKEGSMKINSRDFLHVVLQDVTYFPATSPEFQTLFVRAGQLYGQGVYEYMNRKKISLEGIPTSEFILRVALASDSSIDHFDFYHWLYESGSVHNARDCAKHKLGETIVKHYRNNVKCPEPMLVVI